MELIFENPPPANGKWDRKKLESIIRDSFIKTPLTARQEPFTEEEREVIINGFLELFKEFGLVESWIDKVRNYLTFKKSIKIFGATFRIAIGAPYWANVANVGSQEKKSRDTTNS